MINGDKILDDLILDEGIRLKPYRDTKGKLTIGIGRNLDDNGISEDEARMLAENDIDAVCIDLARNIPWGDGMPEPVQRAIVNMAFNLGWPRLSKFKKMLAALESGDFETAAVEALDSKWAREDVSPERSGRIAKLLRSEP